MDLDFLKLLNNYTLETILISIVAFLLTYILKIPVKKSSSKLTEEKRKMVNVVIIFIPLIICYISSTIYYGITQGDFISFLIIDSSLSAWLLSLSLYAIFSKIIIIIKGLLSGKIQYDEISKTVIKTVNDNIKTISKKLKIDEKEMNNCIKKLEDLIRVKNNILKISNELNLEEVTKINSEINNLTDQKNKLYVNIENTKKIIESYKQK